jgi:protein-disulfide isomerase
VSFGENGGVPPTDPPTVPPTVPTSTGAVTLNTQGIPITARENARERARELRELHSKQDRRRRLVVQSLVVFGSVLVIAIVALVLVRTQQNAGPGPLNMLSDGIKIGAGLQAVPTDALKSNDDPVPSTANKPGVVDIQIYMDYLCANCGTFQQKNGEQLGTWVDSGAATVEIHPIALLTTKSAGTQYSLRAADAAACVAQFAPDQFYAFHTALLTDQPKEGSAGLDDAAIVKRAQAAGVGSIGSITSCIDQQRFKPWVQAATARALEGPIPNSDVDAIAGQLTIIVNGKEFDYATMDPNEFAQFVVQAAGESFADDNTATATPTPTPTPTPAP